MIPRYHQADVWCEFLAQVLKRERWCHYMMLRKILQRESLVWRQGGFWLKIEELDLNALPGQCIKYTVCI